MSERSIEANRHNMRRKKHRSQEQKERTEETFLSLHHGGEVKDWRSYETWESISQYKSRLGLRFRDLFRVRFHIQEKGLNVNVWLHFFPGI